MKGEIVEVAISELRALDVKFWETLVAALTKDLVGDVLIVGRSDVSAG